MRSGVVSTNRMPSSSPSVPLNRSVTEAGSMVITLSSCCTGEHRRRGGTTATTWEVMSRARGAVYSRPHATDDGGGPGGYRWPPQTVAHPAGPEPAGPGSRGRDLGATPELRGDRPGPA